MLSGFNKDVQAKLRRFMIDNLQDLAEEAEDDSLWDLARLFEANACTPADWQEALEQLSRV